MKRYLCCSLIAAAILCAIGLWLWWTSFGTVNYHGRPQGCIWDVVSRFLRLQGYTLTTGQLDNPLVRIAAYAMMRLGPSTQAMTAAQLPFLILLIVSVAMLAWRYAGGSAGGTAALSAWICVFAPTTVGLAVVLDDLLALQALLCAALVPFAWADHFKWKLWTGVAVFPVFLATQLTVWFSNVVLFLGTFSCAVVAILFFQRRRPQRSSKGAEESAAGGHGLVPAAMAVLIVVIGLLTAHNVSYEYLAGEMVGQKYATMNVLDRPALLLAYPAAWFFILAGPVLAVLTGLSIFIIGWKRRISSVAPFLVWLFVPMLLLGLIAKRNDYYLVSAVPAAYVIVGVGFVSLRRRTFRIVGTIGAVIALAGAWLHAVTAQKSLAGSLQEARVFDSPVVPYLAPPLDGPGTSAPLRYDVVLSGLARTYCTQRGLSVVLIRAAGPKTIVMFDVDDQVIGWSAFHELDARPWKVIGRIDRRATAGRLCVFAEAEAGKEPPASVPEVLAEHGGSDHDWIPDGVGDGPRLAAAVRDWIELATQNASSYVPRAYQQGWIVFAPE